MQFTVKDLPLPASLIPATPMSDDELLEFCARNDLLRVERTRNGEIHLMSPTGAGTGSVNSEINRQLANWAYAFGGVVFDSNAGFSLPDGSMMSPDGAWVSSSRWNALSAKDRARFAPLCPEFVIELRSPATHCANWKRRWHYGSTTVRNWRGSSTRNLKPSEFIVPVTRLRCISGPRPCRPAGRSLALNSLWNGSGTEILKVNLLD